MTATAVKYSILNFMTVGFKKEGDPKGEISLLGRPLDKFREYYSTDVP